MKIKMAFQLYSEFVNLYEIWKTKGNKAILKEIGRNEKFEQFTLDALLSLALKNHPFKKLVRKLMDLGADPVSELPQTHFIFVKRPINAFRGNLKTAKILFRYPVFTKQIVNEYLGIFGGKTSKHYKFLRSQRITANDFDTEKWTEEMFMYLAPPSVENCVKSILYSRFSDWVIKYVPEDDPEYPKCLFVTTSRKNNYHPSSRVSECVKKRTFDDSIIETLKKELEIMDFYDMSLCETVLSNKDFEAIDFLIKLGLSDNFNLSNYNVSEEILLYLSQNLGPTDFKFDYWRMEYVSIKEFDKLLELFAERQFDLIKLQKMLPSMKLGLDTYLGIRKSVKRAIEENMAECW